MSFITGPKKCPRLRTSYRKKRGLNCSEFHEWLIHFNNSVVLCTLWWSVVSVGIRHVVPEHHEPGCIRHHTSSYVSGFGEQLPNQQQGVVVENRRVTTRKYLPLGYQRTMSSLDVFLTICRLRFTLADSTWQPVRHVIYFPFFTTICRLRFTLVDSTRSSRHPLSRSSPSLRFDTYAPAVLLGWVLGYRHMIRHSKD